MKKILKPLFCAAAIVSLAGCNKFDEANATPETSNGSLIKVYANVAENDGTRANINVGESVFTAEWEAGDALGILPVKTGGTAPATAAKFDYNTASAAFEGSAAAITMRSSPTRRSQVPRPTSRSGTCVRRRATISTAPTTRWSLLPRHTAQPTRRAKWTATP